MKILSDEYQIIKFLSKNCFVAKVYEQVTFGKIFYNPKHFNREIEVHKLLDRLANEFKLAKPNFLVWDDHTNPILFYHYFPDVNDYFISSEIKFDILDIWILQNRHIDNFEKNILNATLWSKHTSIILFHLAQKENLLNDHTFVSIIKEIGLPILLNYELTIDSKMEYLSHGDLKLSNIVFEGNKSYLIDWENAHFDIKYYDLIYYFNETILVSLSNFDTYRTEWSKFLNRFEGKIEFINYKTLYSNLLLINIEQILTIKRISDTNDAYYKNKKRIIKNLLNAQHTTWYWQKQG